MVTETIHRNFLQRIMDSLIGVLVGVGLFFVSFILLFWNEGRLDIGKYVDKNAVMVSVAEAGDLSYVTDNIQADSFGDTYLQKSNNYIQIKRIPEIYAWQEIIESDSKTELGGSETTTKRYVYEMKWLSRPKDSDSFKEPEGHRNPQFTFLGANLYSPSALVGGYTFEPQKTNIPFVEVVFLTEENAIETNGFALQGNQFLYDRVGASNNAEIGDVRIYYEGVEANKIGTIFGLAENNKISTYNPEEEKVLHLRYGNRDEAIATLRQEHSTETWIFRGLGFVSMWIGMMFILRPLPILMSIIPILGRASSGIIALVTFFVALALSTITILASIIFHNIWFLIGVIAIILAVIPYITKKRRITQSLRKQPPRNQNSRN